MIIDLERHRASLVAAACLLLASCDGGSGVGADGYTFGPKEREQTSLVVSVVIHDDMASLRADALDAGAVVPFDRELMAWSVLTPKGCTIHTLDPDMAYEPEWLGHETAHCVWGRWHP